ESDEDCARSKKRHQSHPRSRIARNSYQAHDARRDRNEEHAEDGYAKSCNQSLGKTEISGKEPRHDCKHGDDYASTRQYDISGKVGASALSIAQSRAALTESMFFFETFYHGCKRCVHSRKSLEHGKSSRSGDRSRADVSHIRSPYLVCRHLANRNAILQFENFGKQRRYQPIAYNGKYRDQNYGCD